MPVKYRDADVYVRAMSSGAGPISESTAAVLAELWRLKSDGQTIAAIKLLKDTVPDMGLAEAKEYIEEMTGPQG